MNKIRKNYLLFILLIAGFLLANSVLAQNFGLNAVGNGLGGSLSASDPRELAGRIINIGLGFLGVVALGFIAYAGFLWMTSNGDEEKITTAKSILRNGAIGLVIILSSWAIATFIISKLMGATGSGGLGCVEGQACGCGGALVCSGETSYCSGSECGSGGYPAPTSCDLKPGVAGTCSQPVDNICAKKDYCDHGDCACKPKGNLGDPCNANSGGGAVCSPDSARCGEYLTCNPSSCTCYGPPVITEISPVGGFCAEDKDKACVKDSDCGTTCNLTTPNGVANNFITIFGKNFGEYSTTTSSVIFKGDETNSKMGQSPSDLNAACINTWRDDQIIIAVPSGVATGPIVVNNKDGLADATNDSNGPKISDFVANRIQRPGLCNLNPSRGVLSSAVGYQGINLYSGVAYFGNYQNNVSGLNSQFINTSGLSGTSTIPNIQSGDASSFVKSNKGLKSNYLRFIKDPEAGEGPFISSFSPTTGNSGQYVTIKGNGFGSTRGVSHVYFYSLATSTEAAYDFPEICANSVWNNNQIIVKVPAALVNLPNNDYKIKIINGAAIIDTATLNPSSFRFDKNSSLKPSLCKIEPVRGPIGTPVSLWGEYFGQINFEALVKFNNDRSATGTIKQDGRANLVKTAVPTEAITGPVKIVKGEAGNELNFLVGACSANADCGDQFCCPSNTYKKGRCVSSLNECFIDIPTSVFEWKFNAGFGTSTVNPFNYSCAGLAKYSGSCAGGSSCPNTTGICSPYAGGASKVVGTCDSTCNSVKGCEGGKCTYDDKVNQCVTSDGSCSLPTVIGYTITSPSSTITASTTAICNANKNWQITLASSCPDGWVRATSSANQCVDINPSHSCSLCANSLTCASNNGLGRCVSPKICQGGAKCISGYGGTTGGSCVTIDQPTCDCCCQKGQDARDCCAPLKCTGTCGSDTGGGTLGRCGGCASAGPDQAAHDAACNCSGHSGQFCDTNNSKFPDGVCSDCSSLNTKLDCNDHSSVCCLDARKTATTTDDICRGGDGQAIATASSSPGFGYCAYYKCDATDRTKCAFTPPLVLGTYSSTSSCATDCAKTDPCSGIKDIDTCLLHSNCCFDAKAPAGKAACRLGTQITGSSDAGYCAYYNCSTGNPSPACNLANPVKVGTYNSTSSCSNYCVNKPTGPGLYCGGLTTSTCASTKCNFPGFGCLLSTGDFGLTQPDCGTCCCKPVAAGVTSTPANDACTAINSKLNCAPNRGNCAGAGRGLCCGCSSDDDCKSNATIGCGSDTCCQTRPSIEATTPKHLAQQVCLNAAIKVDFDQPMSVASFSSNVLLLAQKDSCENGTFFGSANSVNGLLANHNQGFWSDLKNIFKKLTAYFNGSVLADTPGPDKSYCLVAGTTSGENNNNKTSLIFTPQTLLDPDLDYYFIVLGDSGLNSQTGVLSTVKIGFNGLGYLNGSSYVPGGTITFNNHHYVNSQIIKFSTRSKASNSGICAVDNVKLGPESYLFKTTENDLNENDNDSNAATFDTVSDHDKVFTASAYSSDDQLLRPVLGYSWDWKFSFGTPDIVATSSVSGLEPNKIFVTARTGVSDGETKITATVDMNRFSSALACTNDCNINTIGNGFNASSDAYVFICSNPWPPVQAGNWSPWVDTCPAGSTNCGNFNYKFYYCRDAGAAGTFDDLPAITKQAVIRGSSDNLVCSVGRQSCASAGAPCGSDANGNGQPDGICIWDVLKESYFFREAVLSGIDLKKPVDLQTGGNIQVNWQSPADGAASYKIYYLKSGSPTMLSQEFKAPAACGSPDGGIYTCTAQINNLTNNVAYVFRISVISNNSTESALSNEQLATPTDKIAPVVPSAPNFQIINNSIKFSWASSGADVAAYKLLHRVDSATAVYPDQFSVKGLSQVFSADKFVAGKNFFALSTVDANGNESRPSAELSCQIHLKSGCSNLGDAGCLVMNCCTGSLSCGQFLGLRQSGVVGTATCNSNFSGRDTSGCVLSPHEFLTPPIPKDSDTSGTPCLVQMNIDSNNVLECGSSPLRANAQWFAGQIFIDKTRMCTPSYCAVTYKDVDNNTKLCQTGAMNLCRPLSGSCDPVSQPYNWTGFCHLLNTR